MMTVALKGLDFLGKERVRIPVGGVMTPDLIGYWSGGIAYSVLAELDKSIVESEGVNPSLVEGNGPWYRYFFKTFDECQAAIETLQIEGYGGRGLRRPDQEWRFESPADKLLNMSRDDNPFGDPAAFSVRLSTLRSKKYRHELHFISLPAAVAAAATRLGHANPGFPMNELLDQDTIFTDEFQAQMIGDPDTGDYSESVLWQRRATLWEALGESDARKYQPTGTGTRLDTESEKLSLCLQILATKWAKPIWGRLMLVPDPRVDAVYESSGGDTRRLSVPALVEIFPDEAAARAAAEAEGAESEGASTSSGSTKAVPDAYVDYPDMFHQAVERFKAKGVQGPPPVIAAAIGAEPDFQGCDPAKVIAWL